MEALTLPLFGAEMAGPTIGGAAGFGGGILGDIGVGTVTLGQGLATLGTVAGAMGALSSARNQSAMLKYNAQQEQQRAQQVQDQANADAALQKQKTARQLGDIAAGYGAAGVEMQGTPLEVMSDQASQGELSRQLTLYKGGVQADNYQKQAQLDQWQAGTAATSGYMTAGTTLLGGIAKTYGGSASTASQPSF